MRLTHLGHACVHVEAAGASVLIDPGTLSEGFEALMVDAVLVTHQHFDHVDATRIAALLELNPGAELWTEPSGAAVLATTIGVDPGRIRSVAPGDGFAVGALDIAAVGGTHALIHADVEQIANIGFWFPGEGLLHPGDEFLVPEHAVRVLATPISGPWQRLGDAVDYVRDVAPDVAIPIHEGMLARPQIYVDYLTRLKPEATTLSGLPRATPTDI